MSVASRMPTQALQPLSGPPWVLGRLTAQSLALSLWEAPTSMLLVLSPLCWKFSHHSVRRKHLPLPQRTRGS